MAFYYTTTSVHLHNNNSALNYSDFVVGAIKSELLKLVQLSSVVFLRWLLIPCQFSSIQWEEKAYLRSQACQLLC